MTDSEHPLPPETEAAVVALEDARQELLTEEGLIAKTPGAPPEEDFVIEHGRVLQRIDAALKPFEGKYDDTLFPTE